MRGPVLLSTSRPSSSSDFALCSPTARNMPISHLVESSLCPTTKFRERSFSLARHYGLLGGVRYAEPFVQKEVGLVDDLTLVPVASI